jgi:hypothetical protein
MLMRMSEMGLNSADDRRAGAGARDDRRIACVADAARAHEPVERRARRRRHLLVMEAGCRS